MKTTVHAGDLPATGPAITVRFRLNGADVALDVDPAERLLETLRYRLGLTGTKEGCAEGECGACTVHVDGVPANSCLVLTFQVEGRDVESVESLDAAALAPFLAGGATQCGACTPGVVMTAAWVVGHPELLETHRIRELMAGNLCRCTGYDGIVESVEAALPAADET
ncbi:MAG TPA: 2Fe-2S iron-sulfur cluster-binding protein [Gemmatimonadota bacterium]|nr:2Fe-2S iron-sulfur cluster-binding protein [Gemmatimonadota bacterium]